MSRKPPLIELKQLQIGTGSVATGPGLNLKQSNYAMANRTLFVIKFFLTLLFTENHFANHNCNLNSAY
jgi:hypothetical protein